MKLIIVGIDGATWEVMNFLFKLGRLPNIHYLVKNGSYGTMTSTIPPVTGCAWLSMCTGLNPGKTGVIDFLKMNEKKELMLVNSLDFKNKALWDLLSLYKKSCVVLDYPMLFPSYSINGAIISTWGGEFNVSPRYLQQEIKTLVGSYNIFVPYNDEKYDDIDLFLTDLNSAMDKKIKVTEYFLKHYQWDLFVNIISFTDWIQHRMWHYIDKDHPLHNECESSRIMPLFIDFWSKLDKLIGKMFIHSDYMFIVSDHGMGPQYGCFNLAKWLENKRYIIRKHSYIYFLKTILSLLKKTPIPKIMPEKIKIKGRTLDKVIGEVDLVKSKVYICGHTIPFGAIYINKDSYIKQQQSIKSEIITSLFNIKNDINEDLSIKIYDTSDIYFGTKSHLLPDLIFTINDWSSVIIKKFNDNYIYKNIAYTNRHTGSHRLQGIFMAYGPRIKEGFKMPDVRIYDVAPTILHLFNTPIPDEIDGRVLNEIFRYE